MFEIIAILALLSAVLTLIILSAIDLKTWLLPNEYVLALGISGAIFHLATAWYYLSPTDMMLGAVIGGGFLYLVRAGANYYYKQDALGLGDVKLLAAAGLWLGPEFILFAITAGAAAGVVHGIGFALWKKMKTGEMPSLRRMPLPAGPGFAAGILVAGALQLHTIGNVLWP